jgi:hypothetical protein
MAISEQRVIEVSKGENNETKTTKPVANKSKQGPGNSWGKTQYTTGVLNYDQ